MQDTGVAILPGADFGRQPEELSARIAYVDFNGKEAISGDKEYGHENNLSENFIKKFCPQVVEGFDRLEEWLYSL